MRQAFEKFLKEKLTSHETPLDTVALWEAIHQRRRRRRLLVLWWWSLGGAAVTTGIWVLVQPCKSTEIKPVAMEPRGEIAMEAKTIDTVSGVVTATGGGMAMGGSTATGGGTVAMGIKPIATVPRGMVGTSLNNGQLPALSSDWAQTMALAPLPLRWQVPPALFMTPPPAAVATKPRVGKTIMRSEWFAGAGGGPIRRTGVSDPRWPGEVTALAAWQAGLRWRQHFSGQWFAEVGLQVHHLSTRLDLTQRAVERVPIGETTVVAIHPLTNNPYVREDTVWVSRTTTRRTLQYQHLTNLLLAVGVGKRWTQGRWQYDLAAGTAIGLGQLGTGRYVNEAGGLVAFRPLARRFSGLSAQGYAQANYQWRERTGVFVSAGYQHYFVPLEREARYGLPYVVVGIRTGGRR